MSARRSWRSLSLGVAILVSSTPARADEPPGEFADAPAIAQQAIDAAISRLSGEPSVAELQLAAISAANLSPERDRSLERRMRAAALAPSLQVRASGGNGDLYGTSDLEGATRVIVGENAVWQVGVSATWPLDRLVFNPEEVRFAREAQRIGSRREHLRSEITRLYFERRRLQLALFLGPPMRRTESLDARLRFDEITALIDGLTDNALSRLSRRPTTTRAGTPPGSVSSPREPLSRPAPVEEQGD